MQLRAILVLFTPVALAQVATDTTPITASGSAGGLTLQVSAACSASGTLCPFRAEVHAPPALARRIQRVEYTFVPDRRTAPSANTNSETHFRFEGSQSTGELVYADVFLAQPGSGQPKRVLLETAIPFSAPIRPALPAGLRFEDKYQVEYLEGTLTDYYQFRVRLRGEATALKRIKSVEYRLPEQYFSPAPIRARADLEYFLSGGASKQNKWDIVAVIRWTNGSTSTHRIPFRPE